MLLSRNRASQLNLMVNDNASHKIINQTDPEWKDYVRLYFRPRTPTQYNNEGFRPSEQIKLDGAYVPIPIFFLFNSKKILSSQKTLFTTGNLATKSTLVGNTMKFLESIPFEKVYHDSSLYNLYDDEKREIILHRHAEVITRDSLDLSCLEFICCRSQAELETLIDLLPKDILKRWKPKIILSNKYPLFYKEWPFVTRVVLDKSKISLTFNPAKSDSDVGPFNASLDIKESYTNKLYTWKQNTFNAKGLISFPLSNLESYKVTFFLDEKLAYQNTFVEETDIPF